MRTQRAPAIVRGAFADGVAFGVRNKEEFIDRFAKFLNEFCKAADGLDHLQVVELLGAIFRARGLDLISVEGSIASFSQQVFVLFAPDRNVRSTTHFPSHEQDDSERVLRCVASPGSESSNTSTGVGGALRCRFFFDDAFGFDVSSVGVEFDMVIHKCLPPLAESQSWGELISFKGDQQKGQVLHCNRIQTLG